MDRVTKSGEVLEKISERKLLWKSIVGRRNEWIGRIMRHEVLLKLMIMEGKNRRGRPE